MYEVSKEIDKNFNNFPKLKKLLLQIIHQEIRRIEKNTIVEINKFLDCEKQQIVTFNSDFIAITKKVKDFFNRIHVQSTKQVNSNNEHQVFDNRKCMNLCDKLA